MQYYRLARNERCVKWTPTSWYRHILAATGVKKSLSCEYSTRKLCGEWQMSRTHAIVALHMYTLTEDANRSRSL